MSQVVHLNGRFVPASEARVGVFDRGFLYGDGLFDTLRVAAGGLAYRNAHLARLERSLAILRIPPPLPRGELVRVAEELVRRNAVLDGALRIQVTRGPGPRGYSPPPDTSPTLLVSTHPLPPEADAPTPSPLNLVTAQQRLWSGALLNALKTLNKLPQVLARAEAETAGADDALLLNERDEVVAASGANLFWLSGRCLHTPPLSAGPLPGIARGAVWQLARTAGWQTRETNAPITALYAADGVFVTNAIRGPVPVASLNGRELSRSAAVTELRRLWLGSLRPGRA